MVRKKIIILGGGSAGWLTALFIKKVWSAVDVTVVEDPNGKPIIAGESCTIPFVDLLEFLNVPIDLWRKEVGGIPKLGGKFVNWSGKNDSYIQPLFSRYLNRYLYRYPEFGNHNDFILGLLALNLPISHLSASTKLILEKKVPYTCQSNIPILNSMWHFDSRKNAEYLKKLGIERNISLVEKKFVSANLKTNGNLDSLVFEDNTNLAADWFFDCSGFSQLLLRKTLKQVFKDFSKEFPATSVVAWWDESSNLPYTEMTALKNGWSFDVSLEERSGRGYVYDNSRITKEQAIEEINLTFNKDIIPVASLTWEPSLSLNPWTKNVIGIGLSTGFPEPLGSPGHTLIGLQLRLLSEYWSPGSQPDSFEERNYNIKYQSMITDIIDFINVHYITSRDDSDFWKDLKHRKIPESLKDKLDQWSAGCVNFENFPVYSFENYAAVLQGNRIIDFNLFENKLNYKRKNILETVQNEYYQLLEEIQFITRDCLTIDEWRKND
jgi:tryptophan halogenase